MRRANPPITLIDELEDVALVLALNLCYLLVVRVLLFFFVELGFVLVAVGFGTRPEVHFLLMSRVIYVGGGGVGTQGEEER